MNFSYFLNKRIQQINDTIGRYAELLHSNKCFEVVENSRAGFHLIVKFQPNSGTNAKERHTLLNLISSAEKLNYCHLFICLFGFSLSNKNFRLLFDL